MLLFISTICFYFIIHGEGGEPERAGKKTERKEKDESGCKPEEAFRTFTFRISTHDGVRYAKHCSTHDGVSYAKHCSRRAITWRREVHIALFP